MELMNEIETLSKEKEELLKENDSIKASYEQAKWDLKELREAWNKAVNEQRVSATSVFEKEVQLLNDSDALAASFTSAKQEIEKELKQTKSQLSSAITDKDRFLNERDDLIKRVGSLELERKNLKVELKELKSRETKLFNENSELEEENVSLQKQVSKLRSTQVEFESSKHEIQRLHDEAAALNSQLEEMVTLKRITERQMQEALEALQSEREQKYALRKELDKRNSTDPLLNWSSIAALKGSPHLANLALRNYTSSNRSIPNRETVDISPNGCSDTEGATDGTGTPFGYLEQSSYDVIHELEMPSIEGSLFDEVHLSEIKKLQQNLEEKENQRSNLNTKLIEIQHRLESKARQASEIEEKLVTICSLVEEIHSQSEFQKSASPTIRKSVNESGQQQQQQVSKSEDEKNSSDASIMTSNEVTSTTNDTRNSPSKAQQGKPNILDDFENIYSHLQAIFNEFKSYQEISANAAKATVQGLKKDPSQASDLSLIEQTVITDGDKKVEAPETLNSDDVQSLRAMLYKKHEQLRQLRTILKSNKESAEVALKNLKSKYDMEKAIVAETMTKLRSEHKRLNEDAATFTSIRSQFSARIEEYNSEIEKLQSKLAASEQEKNTVNSILRLSIEQKVMLTQKLEALEMERLREDAPNASGSAGNRNANGKQPRSGLMRGRGSVNRSARSPRIARPSGNERR